MTVSKKSVKKQRNALTGSYKKIACIPGSGLENCQEQKPSHRHLKTFHGEFFYYKGIKGLIIRLIKKYPVYRVPNTLLFSCPEVTCQENLTFSNIERHLAFCMKNDFDYDIVEPTFPTPVPLNNMISDTESDSLLYDPDEQSIIAYNQKYNLAICTLHQIGFQITSVENEMGDIVGFKYGSNHLKQHHFAEKDCQEWLSNYLLQKYQSDENLFHFKWDESTILCSQLATLDEPIDAIEGIEVVEGIECCLCISPKKCFKLLSKSSKESNRTLYLWRHYKNCHNEYCEINNKSINDLLLESKQIFLQSIHNVTFSVVKPRAHSIDDALLLFQSLYPTSTILSTNLSNPNAPDTINESNHLKNSGIESKYRFQEQCLDLETNYPNHRKELLKRLEEPLATMLVDAIKLYIKQCMKDIDDFGINGKRELENIRPLETASIDRYLLIWNQFFSFLCMACKNHATYSSWLFGLERVIIDNVLSFYHLLQSAGSIETIKEDVLILSMKNILLSVMKAEIEFSRNDSFVLVLSFIKLATFVQGVAVNGITIQHYCTVLKYLFRATAVFEIKSIERDSAYQSLSVKNRVAIQLEILPLIPKDATVNQTYPFGRLNAFAADIARLSGVVKRPVIEDQTMESGVLGAAIVAQQSISLPLLLNGVEMMLNQALEIIDDLLLGFNYTSTLLNLFDQKNVALSDSGTFSMIPDFCIEDWVVSKLKHHYVIDPVHCDIDRFSYFLSTDPSTRTARIHSYIEQCDTLTDILITLVHLTSGPCARATELATTFYRNCPESQRSLIFSNGYLCLVYTYNKTNALTGSIKTIVRPIATPVAKQLLLYCVLIRPFKERLVGIKKNSVAWKSMWTRGKNQISPEQVRSAILFYSSKYNIRLGIKLSRQYISWICVKYLNYIDVDNVELDIYSGFGHGKSTSLQHYAHTVGD